MSSLFLSVAKAPATCAVIWCLMHVMQDGMSRVCSTSTTSCTAPPDFDSMRVRQLKDWLQSHDPAVCKARSFLEKSDIIQACRAVWSCIEKSRAAQGAQADVVSSSGAGQSQAPQDPILVNNPRFAKAMALAMHAALKASMLRWLAHWLRFRAAKEVNNNSGWLLCNT